jgi:hypothetical protein
VEWLTDSTGEIWKLEREKLESPDTHVAMLGVGSIEIPRVATGVTTVESIELDRDSIGYLCCNDMWPHHYAFIEFDEVMYGLHMYETEGPLSREAFTRMVQSMKSTPKLE